MVREEENVIPSDSSDEEKSLSQAGPVVRQEDAYIEPKPYLNDEEDIVCARFPHMDFCLCEPASPPSICEILPRLHLCDFSSAMNTKALLGVGITHILNLSSREYTKRKHYFQYFNLDIHSTNEEDIKKNFRITNRFINQSLTKGGSVLIHCTTGREIGPCFALAYLIAHKKLPLKAGLEMLNKKLRLEVSSHFLRQLESYDLEKLAFVSVKYKAVA